jgi:hypothetical protein
MTVRADVAGAVDAAQLHGHEATAGIVRATTRHVLRSCRDGSLHAHWDHDGPKAGWSIPLTCALAWRAGHGAARQRMLCPLCMVLPRVAPRVIPHPR